MRDNRKRIIIVEDETAAVEGGFKVEGFVFIVIITMMMIDHALASLFATITSWFG